MKELIMKSKADNTVKTYNCNFKQWCKWCSDFNLSPLPSTEYHVSLYVTSLVQKKLSVAKVEQSLYAIKWAHELAGLRDPCNSFLVKSTAQGARRVLSRQVVKKEPITPDMLHRLVEKFGLSSNLYDLRTVAMCLTAYCGFLRFSELVNLRCCDVEFHEDHLSLFIEKSKTDQFREGRWIFIAKLDSVACPVRILRKYLTSAKLDTSDDGFLFRQLTYCKSTKSYKIRNTGEMSYTRAHELLIEKLVALGLNPTQFGLHSLRAGGASAAANAGISDRLFKKHGRWRSDSAKDGYVKENISTLLSVSKNLGL